MSVFDRCLCVLVGLFLVLVQVSFSVASGLFCVAGFFFISRSLFSVSTGLF